MSPMRAGRTRCATDASWCALPGVENVRVQWTMRRGVHASPAEAVLAMQGPAIVRCDLELPSTPEKRPKRLWRKARHAHLSTAHHP
jgi:hypothetical protein